MPVSCYAPCPDGMTKDDHATLGVIAERIRPPREPEPLGRAPTAF